MRRTELTAVWVVDHDRLTLAWHTTVPAPAHAA
jgi:hypothetical protein